MISSRIFFVESVKINHSECLTNFLLDFDIEINIAITKLLYMHNIQQSVRYVGFL